MQYDWFVIINPVSGGKAAPKRWHKIKPLFDAAPFNYEVIFTEYRDHAALIAKNAVQQGFRRFVILGGDGTANDVINGLCQSGISTEMFTVAMIPAGTGNDWVRTIGKPDFAMIVEDLIRHETMKHDIANVTYVNDGKEAMRYFINMAGLGFEGAVAKKIYERSSKWQGGKMQYQLAILSTLFVYKHTQLEIKVDGNSSEMQFLSAAIGSGKFNGGGMKQLPAAIFNDGILDLTVIATMSKMKMVISLPKLKTGAHIGMQEVQTFKGKIIEMNSNPPVHMDADGEYLGQTPLRFQVASEQINVIKWR